MARQIEISFFFDFQNIYMDFVIYCHGVTTYKCHVSASRAFTSNLPKPVVNSSDITAYLNDEENNEGINSYYKLINQI